MIRHDCEAVLISCIRNLDKDKVKVFLEPYGSRARVIINGQAYDIKCEPIDHPDCALCGERLFTTEEILRDICTQCINEDHDEPIIFNTDDRGGE